MSLKSLLRVPRAAAYYLGTAGASERNDGRARILMFHGTPRESAATLERILRYVQRHFDVVPLAQVARDAAAGDVRFRRQVALTFDDGLRNNVEVAYPILRRLWLPATFFVCPGLVDSGRWLWNHEARQRLRRLSRSTADIERIILRMKRLPVERRAVMERSIREATPDFVPTDDERRDLDVAGWDALRAIDPRVVTIGSHTLNHPILTSLDQRTLERELAESRRVLEAKLGRAVDEFAYPNGDLDAAVAEAARRHYAIAVTVEQGFVEPGCDTLRLPRVPAPPSVLRLALALHRERKRGRARSSSPRPANPAATWPARGTP